VPPRLVIGIPTRNRAELAVAAVESVLRAGESGVRVVVSDNSTDAAERDRLEVFCDGGDDLVEYVRPPEELAMAAHWEWLGRQIRELFAPTHVAYLTDRLAFTAGALTELVDVVSHHPDRVVSYQWDTVNDTTVPVELVQSQWTGRLLELDASTLLDLSRRGEFGKEIPLFMTCVAPAGLMDAMERRFGDVFGLIAPDYRFGYRCLALCDTILYLDRSCVIQHGMKRSAGISYMRGDMNEDAERFARELSEPRFGATPEPGFETVTNAIFQEYCTVRAEVGGGRLPAPDRRGYLTANAISIDRIAEPAWRERMRELLRRHGWSRRDSARHVTLLAAEMAGYLLRHPGVLARSVKRQLWDRPPGTPLADLLARAGRDPRIRNELRFGSSAEAIAYADANPRARTPHTWPVHRLARAGAIVRDVPR
jgi:hypothetical protein